MNNFFFSLQSDVVYKRDDKMTTTTGHNRWNFSPVWDKVIFVGTNNRNNAFPECNNCNDNVYETWFKNKNPRGFCPFYRIVDEEGYGYRICVDCFHVIEESEGDWYQTDWVKFTSDEYKPSQWY